MHPKVIEKGDGGGRRLSADMTKEYSIKVTYGALKNTFIPHLQSQCGKFGDDSRGRGWVGERGRKEGRGEREREREKGGGGGEQER